MNNGVTLSDLPAMPIVAVGGRDPLARGAASA